MNDLSCVSSLLCNVTEKWRMLRLIDKFMLFWESVFQRIKDFKIKMKSLCAVVVGIVDVVIVVCRAGL